MLRFIKISVKVGKLSRRCTKARTWIIHQPIGVVDATSLPIFFYGVIYADVKRCSDRIDLDPINNLGDESPS